MQRNDRIRVPVFRQIAIAIQALVIGLACGGVNAQSTQENGLALLPDTASAERFAEFVSAVTEMQDDQWLTYVAGHMSAELKNKYRDDVWLDLRRQMRHFWQLLEFRGVGSATENRVSLVGIDPNDPLGWWYEFVVELDRGNSKIITEFNVQLGQPPEAVLAEKISEEKLVAEFDEFCTRLADVGEFSGTVLVARGEKVLLQRCDGMASLEYGVPNNISTKFCLGSLTKLFTAVAIMKLAEEDKLNLEDHVGKYLGDEWLSEAAGVQIQIRHLLSHTGGAGDFFTHPDYATTPRSTFVDVNSFARFVRIDEPEFKPGTQYQYSNSGFILLGAIIEEVAGQDYHDYMKSQIYQPAEMHDTDSYFTDIPTSNLAQGYYRDEEGRLRNNLFTQRIRGCPAGSSYSTSRDLYGFAQRFLSGEILPLSSVARMTSAKTGLGASGYGFGVEHFRSLAGPCIGHSGGGPGVNARLAYYPETKHYVIILCNQHPTTMRAIAAKADELIARWEGLSQLPEEPTRDDGGDHRADDSCRTKPQSARLLLAGSRTCLLLIRAFFVALAGKQKGNDGA